MQPETIKDTRACPAPNPKPADLCLLSHASSSPMRGTKSKNKTRNYKPVTGN